MKKMNYLLGRSFIVTLGLTLLCLVLSYVFYLMSAKQEDDFFIGALVERYRNEVIDGHQSSGLGFQSMQWDEVDLIENLDFSVVAGDIIISTDPESDQVEAQVISDHDDDHFFWKLERGTLKIYTHKGGQNSFSIFSFFGSSSINQRAGLKISLPIKSYQNVELKSTSGDISLEGVAAEYFNFKTVSGDIRAMLDNQGDVVAKTVSGDGEFDLTQSRESMSFKSVSGDFTSTFRIQDFQAKVDLSSVSGDLKILMPSGEFVDQNDLIQKRSIEQIGRIDVKTVSGDAYIKLK